MSRCTKKNCPMVGVSADCDLKDCPYRTEADQNKDTIYREDAIKAVVSLHVLGDEQAIRMRYEKYSPSACVQFEETLVDVLNAIEDIPSADRPQGKWTNAGVLSVHCSNCKSEFHELEAMNFCPNCGADMRGEKDETD